MLVILMVSQSDFRNLAECREQLERAVSGSAAERLAFQILRRLDRAVGAHGDGERRLVIHDIDRDRRLLRLGGGKLDQCVDVAEADVIGAARHQRDRRTGPVALVHRHVEAGLFEIAAVLGEEKPALWALVFPVQNHLELGFGGSRRCGGERHGKADRGSYRDKQRTARGSHDAHSS